MMYCTGAEPVGIDWSELEKRREHRKAIVRKSQRRRRAKARKTGMCSQCCKGIPEKGAQDLSGVSGEGKGEDAAH